MLTQASTISDVASKLLIARLLEDDLHSFEQALQAERAQLAQSSGDLTQPASVVESSSTPPVTQSSSIVLALAMLAADVRMSSDAAYAQALQHSDDAASIASQQYVQQLLAAEKKVTLDIEFARRLQQLEDNGKAGNGTEQDIEIVLGKRRIEDILVRFLHIIILGSRILTSIG